MVDRTDPLNSDLDVKLSPDELTEFWDRAWKAGFVITVPQPATAELVTEGTEHSAPKENIT